jgi:Ni,Fe-hydrogenase III large subunit
VHAGIIEPGHFRFSANGEIVVRLEERLGYVHKGIDGLLTDTDIERAGRIVARISGDSTVAYSFAFARAVEEAFRLDPPPRAKVLRGLMAELERIANHFGDIGAICNDASFSLIHAHCGIFRERVLAATERAFGHRLMMDRIVPGGCEDASPGAARGLQTMLEEIEKPFAEIVRLYDDTPSLQDRTCNTGFVSPALVGRWAAGGYVGRASGRDFDARRDFS